MSDFAWRLLWMVILGGGLLGMAGLLLAVGVGSVRELKMSLEELRHGSDDKAADDDAGAESGAGSGDGSGDEMGPSR